MDNSIRRLVWYERWGDHIVGLMAKGLPQEHAVTAAREADRLINNVSGYRYGHVAAGARRAVEAAIEDVVTGEYARVKEKLEAQRRAVKERDAAGQAVFYEELNARRVLFRLASASAGFEADEAEEMSVLAAYNSLEGRGAV